MLDSAGTRRSLWPPDNRALRMISDLLNTALFDAVEIEAGVTQQILTLITFNVDRSRRQRGL